MFKWLLIIVACVVLITTFAFILGFQKTRQDEIVIYRSGKVVSFAGSTGDRARIKQQALDLLSRAPVELLQAVTPRTIQLAKNEKEVVEIHFKEIQNIGPNSYRKSLKIDRLLLVLEGDHYPAWIFYGHQMYSSGPFVNSDQAGLDALSALLGVKK